MEFPLPKVMNDSLISASDDVIKCINGPSTILNINSGVNLVSSSSNWNMIPKTSTPMYYSAVAPNYSLILPDETEIGYSETIARFSELLTCSESDICVGKFSHGDEVENIPNLPGLQLKIPKSGQLGEDFELKHCSLPICNSQQAQDIISVATKAPYGKGELTLVDETVRKSWQLEPSQFIISNPKWNELVTTIIENGLRNGLGIPKHKRITHSLYKLLLYETDGHFDYHRDTEKESGMFATLVIQLPSVYTGGELIVKHTGVEEIYDFSRSSSYKVSYTGFFCDCEHKVNRVTSGYRLCLVYNVCYNGALDSIPRYNLRGQLEESFMHLVGSWKKTESPFTIWLLEHKYTSNGISTSNLKGRDQVLYTFLSQLNQEHSLFHLFIGIFEKKVSGQLDGDHYDYYGDPGEEEDEDDEDGETSIEVRSDLIFKPSVDYNLENVKTIDGRSFSSLPRTMILSNIIPYDRLENLHFGNSRIEHTGNEGTNLEKWYRNGCLVIVSRQYASSLFQRAYPQDTDYICEQLFKEVANMKPMAVSQIVQFISSCSKTLSEEMIIRNVVEVRNFEILKSYLDVNPKISDFSWSMVIGTFPMSQLKDQFIEKFVHNAFNSTIQDRIDHVQFAINELSKDVNGNIYIKEFLDKIFQRMASHQKIPPTYLHNILRYMIEKNMTFPENISSIILKQADNIIFQLWIPYCAQNNTKFLEEALLSLLSNGLCFVNCYGLFFEHASKVNNNQLMQEQMELHLPIICKNFYEQSIAVSIYCQNNPAIEECKFADNILRNSIWIEFTTQPQLTVNTCISFIYMFCRDYIPDNFNIITSYILSRCSTFDNVESILIPLLKWLETNLRGCLFTVPSLFLLINGAMNMTSQQIQTLKKLPWSWTIEPNSSANCSSSVGMMGFKRRCDTCESLKTYLLDPNKVNFEMRSSQAQREHVESNIEKLCNTTFLDIRKEFRKITITKISSPQNELRKSLPRVEKLFKYLYSLQQQISSGQSYQTGNNQITSSQPPQLVLTNDYSENCIRINNYLDNLLSGCNQVTQEKRKQIFTFFMGIENLNTQEQLVIHFEELVGESITIYFYMDHVTRKWQKITKRSSCEETPLNQQPSLKKIKQ